ncbi:Arsenate reductase [subsurface metagenome]
MEILAAARFARKILPKDVKIFSAGLESKGIHPMVTKVMQEVGIDISYQKSKNISEIPINKIDLVVTLFGNAVERCLVFPGKVERIHWAIEDPAKI